MNYGKRQEAPQFTMGPNLIRIIGMGIAVTLAYYLAGRLGLVMHSYVDRNIILIWLPTGIAVAALLRWGNPLWPAVYGGALLVNLTIGSSPLIASSIAVGNTLGPLLTIWVLRKSGFHPEFRYLRDVLWFVLAAMIGMAVTASGGVTVLWLAAVIPSSAFASAWWTWWMGDAIGILLAAPVLLTFSHHSLDNLLRDPLELLIFVLVLTVVNWFIFLSPFALTLAYIPVLLVIWAALRYGITGASLTVLADATIAAWGTATHHGPFHLMGEQDQIILSIYIMTHAVVSLVITALHAENRHAAEELNASYQRLSKIASRLPGVVYQFKQKPDGTFCIPYASEAIRTLFRLQPEQVREDATQVFKAFHPDDLVGIVASIRDSAEKLSIWQQEFRLRFQDGTERWMFGNSIPERESDGAVLWHGFVTDITPQKEAHDELRRAKEKAEAATRAKSDFLTAMSHEIRTPMNAVIGMGDILLETELTEVQQGYVHKLQQAGNNLLALINQILDLSRIEAGGLTMVEEPFLLRALLDEVTALLRVMAEGKGLRLTCQVDGTAPEWLIGDHLRLRQVLINLLGNAVKFTEQGEVLLQCRMPPESPDQFLLIVTDTGIGIDAEYMGRIFEAFGQADSSLTRHHGGTGLGLTICRQLVTLMGGLLWFESKPGAGSTFYVALPLRVCTAPARVAGSEPGSEIRSLHPLRVLLVDDAEDNQMLIQLFLKKSPHQLTIANHGKEAVSLVQESPFDVVLMDVQMPVMDGYTATRLIRQWEREHHHPRLPIIALTAHALEGEAERSREAGCDLYLTKPIKKQRLLEIIQQAGKQ